MAIEDKVNEILGLESTKTPTQKEEFKADEKIPDFENLKEKQRVMPKQGRVVCFDGYYWHTSQQPSKGVRCIINYNVV